MNQFYHRHEREPESYWYSQTSGLLRVDSESITHASISDATKDILVII